MTLDEAAHQLCDIGRRAYARELVDGTAGNFSARLEDGTILCTPTFFCKGRLTPDDLVLIDSSGRRLAGRREPSSEIALHRHLYDANPAARAVVHTHPPYATTFAVRRETLPPGVLPEGDVFLGEVPLVRYATTGTDEMGQAIRPVAQTAVAALLSNHGAVTWGPDIETAYCLTETLEAVCRIVYQARLLGGFTPIEAVHRSALETMRVRLHATWKGKSSGQV